MIHSTAERFKRERMNELKIESFFFLFAHEKKRNEKKSFVEEILICFQQTN